MDILYISTTMALDMGITDTNYFSVMVFQSKVGKIIFDEKLKLQEYL